MSREGYEAFAEITYYITTVLPTFCNINNMLVPKTVAFHDLNIYVSEKQLPITQ